MNGFILRFEKMGTKDNFAFMYGNDPKHIGFNTRMWILHNTSAQYLKKRPQSRDINLIEHLQDYLKLEIIKYQISSKNDFKNTLLEEQNKMPSYV